MISANTLENIRLAAVAMHELDLAQDAMYDASVRLEDARANLRKLLVKDLGIGPNKHERFVNLGGAVYRVSVAGIESNGDVVGRIERLSIEE